MRSNKAKKLKALLTSKELTFLLGAHNGLSAKIVEEAGFKGIWASGLCMSAAMGVRDNNEATWTQILEVVELMSDTTTIPILLDGDTGYGDFNTVRRLVKKLQQRDIAGVCIEDKLFPKKNSFIDGKRQELAGIEEFCGKIKAAKDSQKNPDFCVVARVEAFIAGWGLKEALKRAQAYTKAGADAVLIHSSKPHANDIVDFMKEWADRAPVVIVPTKYYSTPVSLFEEIGVSMVIWANHLMRASIVSMQDAAKRIFSEKSIVNVEDKVAPVTEIFRLQGMQELRDAEELYQPAKAKDVNAVILAASRGKELGSLTENCPKAMISTRGKPLLEHLVDTLNETGIRDITAVRGYRKDMFTLSNINYIDNDEYSDTKELYSLYLAKDKIRKDTLISFGDILYKKYIPASILDAQADISIIVDADWQGSRNKGRYADYVSCDKPYHKKRFEQTAFLEQMGTDIENSRINGEWIGLFRVKEKGVKILKDTLAELSRKDNFKSLRLADLFNALVKKQNKVQVIYIQGDWLDVDDLEDFSAAGGF